MKCSSKFFTYELSRAKTIVDGLASTLRAIQGAQAMPAAEAAPAASFRKSRRPVLDFGLCHPLSPLCMAAVLCDASIAVTCPECARAGTGAGPAGPPPLSRWDRPSRHSTAEPTRRAAAFTLADPKHAWIDARPCYSEFVTLHLTGSLRMATRDHPERRRARTAAHRARRRRQCQAHVR